jgi:hypothetical protein
MRPAIVDWSFAVICSLLVIFVYLLLGVKKQFRTPKRYFFWFLIVPFVVLLILAVVTLGARFDDEPLWAQTMICIFGVPIFINLFLGPTIYSFWRHKKSRAWISALNLVMVFGGAFPGLLLWIWALKGKVEESK